VNDILPAPVIVALRLHDSTRISARFHVVDGKSILFHLVFRMTGKLVLPERHFASND